MILFPKDNPVIQNLNSYYVDIDRVLEHYQGQIPSGAVHFKAPGMEGVVFFDETEPLSGMVEGRDGTIHGEAAVAHLVQAATKMNFNIAVYEIDPEKIFFWTHLSDARPIYDNLSAEFTDLDALVKKMKSEGLTGLIEVRDPEDRSAGVILFENGGIFEVSSPLAGNGSGGIKKRLGTLVDAARNGGASFSVRQISQSAPVGVSSAASTGGSPDDRDFTMLEELIDIFERAVISNRKDFKSLFRRCCIDNADRFDFLDPFVGEFDYSDRRVTFTGDAEDDALTRGLLTILTELAEELRISNQVRHAVDRWARRWESVLGQYDIQV